jgi:DHA1 family inner membrane transport protein
VAAITWLVPSNVGAPAKGGIAGEVRVLAKPQVWLPMLVAALSSGSLFAVFTYIKPILTDVSGLSVGSVTWVLLLFGAGMTIGNIVGGRLADWKLMPTMIGALLSLILLHLVFAEVSGHAAAAVAVVFVWGVLAFIFIPSIQMRVVESAREAPNLAATLNQGAFNVGNAAGAWLGGAAISFGVSYQHLPFVGAATAAAGLGVALLMFAMDRQAVATGVPAE